MKTDLSHEQLKELMSYDNETGNLVWRKNRSRLAKATQNAGHQKPDGYIQIHVLGHIYQAHVLVWFYFYGYWPHKMIDHINGVRNDNRIENLREASNAQNQQNRKSTSAKNKSGVTGVSWKSELGKWVSQIQANGKKLHLGYFSDLSDAINARLEAEKLHFTHCPQAALKALETNNE